MNANRYSCKTEKFRRHKIPDEWHCTAECSDFNEVINCAKCGKKIRYGHCTASIELYNEDMMPLSVCLGCYGGEVKRRLDNLEIKIRKGK